MSAVNNKKICRSLCSAAGLLFCMVLAGCHSADRAVALPVGEPVEIPQNETETGSLAETQIAPEASVIYVHVCGAVRNPGVVMLPEGSRGQDALEAAGGFGEDAAEEAVNLAAVVTDGMRLYFPTPEEVLEAKSAAQDETVGPVDINSAGVELLCTLPGIGETRARAIVAYREEHGAFGSAEEIMQVSGIKEGAYNKIKALIIAK